MLLKGLPPFCNLSESPLKQHVEHCPLGVTGTIHSTRIQVQLIDDVLEVPKRNILRLIVGVMLRDDGRVKLYYHASEISKAWCASVACIRIR